MPPIFMFLYFACQSAHRFYLKDAKIKNLLISYVHGYKTMRRAIDEVNPERVIIDSGAFSAWTVNQQIDIQEYATTCLQLMEDYKDKRIYFVNLDVIPGEPGRRPTKQEIEYSAEQGWENMLYMESRKIPVMHVYHQHEDEKWLEKLMERQEYFGVSPANDLTPAGRMVWLDRTFSIIKDTRKTHGFGATAKSLLQRYPWYSADSTSWMAPIRYGQSSTGNFKARGIKFAPTAFMKHEIPNEINRWLKIEREMTQLWKGRGVEWS